MSLSEFARAATIVTRNLSPALSETGGIGCRVILAGLTGCGATGLEGCTAGIGDAVTAASASLNGSDVGLDDAVGAGAEAGGVTIIDG